MSTVVRRIRTLRLRAPSDALARRGTALVENALRTASIPDADGGRVYLVRRLRLPPVRAAASSNTVTLGLEQRLASLRSAAVHGSDARAASADIVYFDDEADMHARFIAALALDRAGAWFWRCAEPANRRSSDGTGRLRAAVLDLAAAPHGPVSLARVLEDAVMEEWADAVLPVVQPADGPALLHAAAGGGTARPGLRVAADADVARRDRPSLDSRWTAVLRAWATRWGRDDARSTWLATMATLAAEPALVASPARLISRACAVLDGALATPPTSRPDAIPDPHASLDATTAASTAETQQRPRIDVRGEHPAATGLPARPDATLSRNLTEPDEGRTRAGGLFFVVQVLRRLDFDAFLETDTDAVESQLGETILRAIAWRVGIPADDPVFAALATGDDRTLLVPETPLVRFWITAVRRWCRRTARVGPYTLVHRPAAIAHTRTHIDVTFELRTADVRLRRAGLDFDPGWVPWLGRAVLFHYRPLERP